MIATSMILAALLTAPALPDDAKAGLRLSWADELLTITGPDLPGDRLEVWYLEAFCRPDSTDRDWEETVIPHKTEQIDATEDGKSLKLRSTLADGVVVDSVITASLDEVDFRVTATNPTGTRSEAHWAQPCIRVDRFTGTPKRQGSEQYLPSCFVFIDGEQRRLPTEPWATAARYTPGQVYGAPGVPYEDLNPRPRSRLTPSNGLIGCYSADGSKIMAVAFEPYQELFQGVIVCLHSDFRIGGLDPGESNAIRGTIYLVDADLDRLLERYRKDFPEQEAGSD